MRTGCMFCVCGLVVLVHSPIFPPLYTVSLLPICILVGIRFPILALPMWFACGILWGVFRADGILDNTLPAQLEGKHLTIEGKIVSLPTQLNGGLRFVFDVHRLIDDSENEAVNLGKVRLNWFRNHQRLVPGDIWRLRVKLKRPNGFMNPGGFDYEAWLFQQRISATGYVSRKKGNSRLQEGESYYLHRLRFIMREKLAHSLGDRDKASFVPALVLGDRSGIPHEQFRILTKTGTSHLLAISGLHIGLVAGLVFFLTRWLWPLGGVTALLIPSPKIAALMAMLAASAYAATAGFSIATQRAIIMLLVLLLSHLFSRKFASSSVICSALLLVLIIDPFAVLSAGFWLSFSAISVIAFGMSARVNITGFWWRWGRVQYLVAIGLFPLLVLWFQQVPLSGMLANLFFVPWVSFVTVPLILLGSFMVCFDLSLGNWLLEFGTTSISLFWPFLAALGELDYSVLRLSEPGIFALLTASIGVCLLLMPSGIPARYIGLIWILPIIFPATGRLNPGEIHLTLLDVGQGTAAVIETASHALLFDTGPRFSSRFDAGSAVIIPFLRRRHIQTLDLLIQSHGDNDHIGGLPNILKEIPIKRILTSVPDKITHPFVEECMQGQAWYWDDIRFEMLHPAPNSKLTGNNRSCVLKISNDTGAILLTGDIEARAEKRILKRDRLRLKSPIMIAPHHGSLTSSTERFIDAVAPKYVLFAVGYRNRFGFPKQDIINRYRRADAIILDTAKNGAIEINLASSGMTVRTWRQQGQRFWSRAK